MVTYPNDWSTYPFDEMFQIHPNNTLSRDKLDEHGMIGNIHYGDVLIKYGSVLTVKDSIPKIKADYESAAKSYLMKNDVIVADTAEDETVGKAVQIGDIPFPLVGGLHTIVCRPLIPTAAGYLGYYMNSKGYHDQLLPYITGIKVSSVSKTSIRKTELHVPSSVEEQEAIVHIIESFDTHIADLCELIEKKTAIRDGAVEDLVSGRTRLPGFNDEWQDSRIGQILKILHGKNQHEVESPNGHYPIMGTGGVIGKATDFLCDWECVLIGRKGTIDQPYYMNTPFWTIDTLYYSRPAENQCVKFQYYLFCTINWYEYTEASGRPSLTRKAIEDIEIKLPKYEEQKAIAAVLNSLDNELNNLKEEREKMIHIREGAMNDLLTGRIRLKL